MHFGNIKQIVHHKQHVKREIVQVPQIKTFTSLHQMTNFVPFMPTPQTNQRLSHPTPVQQSTC